MFIPGTYLDADGGQAHVSFVQWEKGNSEMRRQADPRGHEHHGTEGQDSVSITQSRLTCLLGSLAIPQFQCHLSISNWSSGSPFSISVKLRCDSMVPKLHSSLKYLIPTIRSGYWIACALADATPIS